MTFKALTMLTAIGPPMMILMLMRAPVSLPPLLTLHLQLMMSLPPDADADATAAPAVEYNHDFGDHDAADDVTSKNHIVGIDAPIDDA